MSAVHSLRRGQRGGFWLRPYTTDAKLRPHATDAKLIAEHVAHLKSSADRAAAAGLTKVTEERWHALIKQVAIRLDGLEAAIAVRLERKTDAKLIAEHVAYLQSSADRWHARQGVAEHVEYLQRSKRIAMDAKLIAEHMAYLKSSAGRWHARQGVAEHVEYRQRSECTAANGKLIGKHVSYLQDGPQRKDSVLVAEHVSYLKSSADRAAAAGLTKVTEERWHALIKQVAIRLDGLEAAIAVRLERTKERGDLF